MFREALAYPTRSPEGGRSIILGGLVTISISICLAVTALDLPYAYLAAVAVLPWLLLRGYYVRVIRTTIGEKRPTPPRFNSVRRLLTDGTIAVSISIVYLLPGVAVLAPLVAVQGLDLDLSELLASAGVPPTATAVLLPVIGLLAVTAAMALIGAFYVLPVAVARFAYSGRWRDAFELRTVVNGAMTEDYVIAWGVSLLMQVALLPLIYPLRLILVGFFLHFVVMVGVRYCYGQGVGAALKLAPVEPGAPREGSDDTDPVGSADPTPAVVRIGTDRWGVSSGEGRDPMAKAARSDDRTDRKGGSAAKENADSGESTLRPAVRRVPEDDPRDDR